jgi:hypothetical protein
MERVKRWSGIWIFGFYVVVLCNITTVAGSREKQRYKLNTLTSPSPVACPRPFFSR